MGDVIKWDASKKILKGSMYDKAWKFVNLGLIKETERIEDAVNYDILPILGYNSTVYHVEYTLLSNYEMGYTCNCQGFNTKLRKGEEAICSHIIAVRIFRSKVNS